MTLAQGRYTPTGRVTGRNGYPSPSNPSPSRGEGGWRGRKVRLSRRPRAGEDTDQAGDRQVGPTRDDLKTGGQDHQKITTGEEAEEVGGESIGGGAEPAVFP
ncbi:hypothetical protein Dform_01571 [Dehalogenimonas formicexedens]|uniref:Uncharacterized protein n=1 Tax=Dehalogenimonas formicexedens TaxID=1839801 RepID=A0A1P8F8Z6_9CHLR|nr:hypothetical protein Dform_01571 [Dehalogenimonas formicexedens]